MESRSNIRLTWQLINEITGKKVNNIDSTIKNNFKNENTTDIANKFAESFSENVQNILHICDIKTFTMHPKTITNSMYLSSATEDEVYNILKNLKTNKGAGADNIRPKDIKNNALILTPVITTFINTCLKNCVIPKTLKMSIIRPIYKSGPKNDANNYRPIAILSIIEKVLEEIVVCRLKDFLNKFNIINPSQYGFQKGKNINQLLGEFSNHINKCLGENLHCLVMFIDFSKAFDTLQHKNLLDILERNGIRGECLEWFRNYLELRKYRVKIQDDLSIEKMSNFGVPQGSKLGPILYLIYANDMLNAVKDCLPFAYADDTAIVVSDKNINSACEIMQTQLNNISKWCHDNGLVINAAKTKLMHIKPTHLANININICFHNYDCLHNNNFSCTTTCNTIIEVVKTYKYLGVYVDDNFKWLTQIQVLSKKLKTASYSLYHLSNCSTYDVLKQAYYSLAESYIRHGITAWGSSTFCKSLQQSQNQILKILLKREQHNQQQLPTQLIYANTNNNSRSNTNNNNAVTNNNTNNRTDIIINNTQTINNNITTTTSENILHIPRNNSQHNRYNQRNENRSTTNIASILQILNIKSLYHNSLINEFYNDHRFLVPIDHQHNTRQRAEGRYKVPRHKNNFTRNSINITLPKIFNQLPLHLLNLHNTYQRKKLLKKHFIETQ